MAAEEKSTDNPILQPISTSPSSASALHLSEALDAVDGALHLSEALHTLEGAASGALGAVEGAATGAMGLITHTTEVTAPGSAIVEASNTTTSAPAANALIFHNTVPPERFTLQPAREYEFGKESVHHTINSIAFSSVEREKIALCDIAGNVAIQDLNDVDPKRHELPKQGDLAYCVAFSSSMCTSDDHGKRRSYLAVSGARVDELGEMPRVRVFDAKQDGTFEQIHAFCADGTVLDLSFFTLSPTNGKVQPEIALAFVGVTQSLKIANLLEDSKGTSSSEKDTAACSPLFGNDEEFTSQKLTQDVAMQDGEKSSLKRKSSTLKLRRALKEEAYSVDFSACGRWLAQVMKSGYLVVFRKVDPLKPWSTNDGQTLVQNVRLLYWRREATASSGRDKLVKPACCRFSPVLEDGSDSAYIAIALVDKRVIVRDAESGDLRYVLRMDSPCSAVAFSCHRDHFPASLRRHASSGSRRALVEGKTVEARYRDGSVGIYRPGKIRSCLGNERYDIEYDDGHKEPNVHEEFIRAVHGIASMMLAVATYHGLILVDANSGAKAHHFKDLGCNAVAFSPSGYAVAYGTAAPSAKLVFKSLRIDAAEHSILNPNKILSSEIIILDNDPADDDDDDREIELAPPPPRIGELKYANKASSVSERVIPIETTHRGSVRITLGMEALANGRPTTKQASDQEAHTTLAKTAIAVSDANTGGQGHKEITIATILEGNHHVCPSGVA